MQKASQVPLEMSLGDFKGGTKSNQILALDTPLRYDPDNEIIWGDETSNKELIFLRADGTSVRRQSLINGSISLFHTQLGDVRSVRIAKFAPESTLLCLQRGDREVEFVDLRNALVAENNEKSPPISPILSSPNSHLTNGQNGKALTTDNDSLKSKPFRFSQSCALNTKVENKLLGFFWVSSTILVLISKTMIELFSLNQKFFSDPVLMASFSPQSLKAPASPTSSTSTSSFLASSFSSSSINAAPIQKIKEIPVSVNWWTYSAPIRVLLVSTGHPGNQMLPYHFLAGSLELLVLPKFKIELKDCSTVNKAEVYLRQIYGSVFCMFLNTQVKELTFYQLTQSEVSKLLVITNLPNGPIKLSFVDNLVLAHSMSLKVTAVYDIKYRSKDSIIIDAPITPALSISRPSDILKSSLNSDIINNDSDAKTASPNQIIVHPKIANSPDSPKMDDKSSPVSSPSTPLKEHQVNSESISSPHISSSASMVNLRAPFSPSTLATIAPNSPSQREDSIDYNKVFSYGHVQFLIPEYAVNRQNGQIYKLGINYDGVVSALHDPVRLVSFLMRREFSRPTLLTVLRRTIENREDMRSIMEIFNKINGSLFLYTTEKKLKVVSHRDTPERASPSRGKRHTMDSSSMSVSSPQSRLSLPPDQIQGYSSARSSPTTGSLKHASSSADSSTWTKRRAEHYFSFFKKVSGQSKSGSAITTSVSEPTTPASMESFSPSSSLAILPTPEECESLSSDQHVRTSRGLAVISQHDMYTQVFLPCEENRVDPKVLVGVLITYVNSLAQYPQMQIDSYIYELIIDLLVRNKRFYQLHQLLQYHVISDSLHVACQLLHLESVYPPALQLALDMFRRLKENAHILEVLLTKGMLLPALRFLKGMSWTPTEAQRLVPRFLTEARSTEEPTLFYVTYVFFLKRKEIFPSTCEEHINYFNAQFASPEATGIAEVTQQATTTST